MRAYNQEGTIYNFGMFAQTSFRFFSYYRRINCYNAASVKSAKVLNV